MEARRRRTRRINLACIVVREIPMLLHWLLLMLLLTAGLILGAAAQGGDDGDHEKVQGTWKLVSIEVKGKSAGDKVKDHRVVFTKDKMTFKDGDKTRGEFAYKLDPAKKPKWIDMAPIRKDGSPGKTAQGIYELNGDDLKICHPDPGQDRSMKFKSEPDSVLIILKREKPK